MKKEMTIKDKYNNGSLFDIASAMIDMKKIDKTILMEIIGIESELAVYRNLISCWKHNYVIYNRYYTDRKIKISNRVRSNIEKSKMSQLEKQYVCILLNEMIR